MKNTLVDLNNHLFAQLERLANEQFTPEQVAAEIKRAEAMVSVSDSIVDNARLQLEAATLVAEHRDLFPKGLPMLPAGPAERPS